MSQGRKIPKRTWDKFLRALAENASSVSGAAQQLGITARSFYNHCYEDPDFIKNVRRIFDGIRTPFAEDALFSLIAAKNLGAIKYYLSRRGGKRWNYDQIVKQLLEFQLDVKRKDLKDGKKPYTCKRPSIATRIAAKAYAQAIYEGYEKIPNKIVLDFTNGRDPNQKLNEDGSAF